MLAATRYHNRRKLPVLLLVFLLCVQSLSFASHAEILKASLPIKVAEQSMPPCHDMPDMEMADIPAQDPAHTQMPCCDDGQCIDAHCMMPAGTHFSMALQDYFIAHASNLLMADFHRTHSMIPSPPTRPPIA
jgi:hypothetical protein